MDNTLVDYVFQEFKKQSGLDVRNDKSAMMRIREERRKRKSNYQILLRLKSICHFWHMILLQVQKTLYCL